MKAICHILLAASLLTSGSARAAGDAVNTAAENALREGFPQAAIGPLREHLRNAPSADKHASGLLLARALLASGQPQDALVTLDSHTDRNSPDTKLLRATAFAAQGGWDEAAKTAASLAPDSAEASLLLARIRFEQGDAEAARAALALPGGALPSDPNSLRLLLDLQLDAGDPAATEAMLDNLRDRRLLPSAELAVATGRLRLQQSRPSDAAEVFRETLEIADLPAPVRSNARLGLARSLVELGADARAREVLRAGLIESPGDFRIRDSMDLWISLERKAGNDPSSDLKSWAAESGHRRAIEAKLQLARLELDQKRPDAALALLAPMPGDAEAAAGETFRAQVLRAEALILAGRASEALELLDNAPTIDASSAYRMADLRGRALFAQGAHLAACDAFTEAGRIARTPAEGTAAASNALLSALIADDLKRAREAHETLKRSAPDHPDLLRWALLLATAEARDGNIDSLATLARQSPATSFSFQAKLALAEWRLARGEPAAAERILRTARDEAAPEPSAAALRAAEIFAAESSGSRTRDELVRDCRDFLSTHPAAPEATAVAFKLGELHALSGDHAAAESVLNNLAQSLQDPEEAALAKFLAAQSAARSMSPDGAARAMVWFDAVAQGNSPLRHRSRFEQASLLLRDRKFSDALTLYDRILAGDVPTEVRQAALMEKGDTLLAMTPGDPDKLAAAAAVYASVSSDPNAPADWRDQAACKFAASMARAGQTETALAAYREVLSRPPDAAADPFWFYKAGIETGRLLEEQQDWRAAIAVYDQIASAGGPQREELEQRARRLRLEHFIWEN